MSVFVHVVEIFHLKPMTIPKVTESYKINTQHIFLQDPMNKVLESLLFIIVKYFQELIISLYKKHEKTCKYFYVHTL